MQDFLQMTRSSGRITSGVLTLHSGNPVGAVDISVMEGMIFTEDRLGADYIFFKQAAKTDGLVVADNVVSWVYYDWNAGSPRYSSTTTRATIHEYDQFAVGRVFRAGNDVELQLTGHNLYDKDRRSHNRLILKYGGMDRVSGGVVSQHTTPLRIQSNIGSWYVANKPFTTPASATFQVWYKTGGGAWAESGDLTLFSDVFDSGTSKVYETYQNGTSLGSLGANKYGVYWIFMCPEGDLYVVLGTASYANIGAAQASTVPASLPPYCVDWARLVGRVICQKTAAALYSVESSFAQPFTLSAATDHSSLANLTAADSHPITAISSLDAYLSGTKVLNVLNQSNNTLITSYASGTRTLQITVQDNVTGLTSYASGTKTLVNTLQTDITSSNATISGINTSLINLNVYASGIETLRRAMVGGDPTVTAYASGTKTLTNLNQSDITRVESCTSGIYQSQFYLRNRTSTNLPNARMLGYDAKYIANTVDVQAGMQDYEEWTINPDVVAYWSGSQTVGQANQVDINLLQNYASGIETLRQAMVSGGDTTEVTTYASGINSQLIIVQSNAIQKTDYDENTILVANSDDNPQPTLILPDRIVGRLLGGNTSGLTITQVLDLTGGRAEGDTPHRTADGWECLSKGNVGDLLSQTLTVPAWSSSVPNAISGVNVLAQLNQSNNTLITSYASGTRTLEITMQNTATGLNTYASGIETLRRAMVTTAASSAYPRGYIDGLITSTYTTSGITTSIGACRDGSDASNIVLATGITKKFLGGWTAGNLNNGIDSGNRTASTWYHTYAILKDSDSSVDALFSTNATAPTMPAGYTYKRRIGSVLTDATAFPVAFTQNGDTFQFSNAANDVTNYALGTAEYLATLSVPLGVAVLAKIHLYMIKATPTWVEAYTPGQIGAGITIGSIHGIQLGAAIDPVRTNTSSQIALIAFAAATQTYISTRGWIDPRGKDA
jgi:hypothetical protein